MILDKVIEIISAHKEIDPALIGIDTKLADLKLDSLDTVELVMALEEAYDINLEVGDSFETVGDVVKAIEGVVVNA